MTQEPSINFSSILLFIGAVQGVFLAVALFFMRRGNRQANLFLAALLLSLSVVLIDGFMHLTNYYIRYPRLLGMLWPAKFLLGPFLYFYVRELTSPRRTVFSWTQFLNFLPATAAALLIVHHVSAYGNAPGWACAICSSVFIEGGQIPPRAIAIILLALQKNPYYILSFLLIMSYSAKIKQSFSSLGKISLSWLRTILLLFFTVFFIFIFFIFFSAHFGIERQIVYILFLCLAAITSVMAFKAILQPEIFLQIEIAHQAELIRTGQSTVLDAPSPTPDILQNGNGMLHKEKYRKSFLANERAAEIARKLLQLMETEKPFLNPDLTLLELADRLSVSANHLSQVINREMNKSFFDFVNEYRVQEAKRLLNSPQSVHLSIFGIALDAGFNSKSAFYNAFSKHLGMTPSGYRKQCEFAEQSAVSNIQGNA